MEEGTLILDLSDDDEDNVIRTIELQKRLILESQSLIKTQIDVIASDHLPRDSDGENNLSTEDTATASAEGEEIPYCNALAANLEYDNYLARLETNLKTLITECKTNLDGLASVREDNKRMKGNSILGRSNHVYIFGTPFFKDQNYYPCPPNADTISKTQSDELCWADLPMLRWWKPIQTRQVVEAVKEQSKQACRKDALSEKSALVRSCNALEENSEERKKLEEEIKNFNVDDYVSRHLNEKIATIDHDWLQISASVLNGKHSAEECRAFWYNYLHPKFFKGSWTQEEDAKLRSLADQNNCQNWDLIAEELGTGRSGYQCFAQYQSEQVEVSKQKWTDAEDDHLKALVQKFRVGDYIPWSQVTIHMKNRTKTQLYNRWTYSLNPKIKKGRFTLQEDIIILRGIQKWGEDFQKIASYMPDRMAPQIRIRYHSGISKTDFTPWTKEEDKILLDLVKQHGHNWTKITKHFTGKTADKIRRRHTTLSKWMEANPGKPLAQIGSRRNIKTDIYNAYPEMWAFADKLLSAGNPKSVSTSLLLPHQPVLKPKRHTSKVSLIDQKLAEYFRGVYSKPTALVGKFTSLPECDPKLISEVALFLELLGAKLSIPCDESLDDDESLDPHDRQILKGLRSAHPKVLEAELPQPDFEHVNVDDIPHNDTNINIDPSIDYVEQVDPSSTQVTLPYSFVGPFPVSLPTSTNPEPEVTPVKPAHSLFGNLKYLCPPNFSTLVGLRSILLGKRKLVESVAEFATDPILSDFDNKNNATFRRVCQLWDDRLMCLFALANMLCKTKPPKNQDVDVDVHPGPSGQPPSRGVNPDSDCEECKPGTTIRGALDVSETFVSDDGVVRVCTKGLGKKKRKQTTSGGPAKKRARKT